MYSSTAGIIPSLVIAGTVLILSWIVLSRSTHYSETGPLGVTYALGVATASFAAAFSVLNLAVQGHVVSQGLIGKEIGNGILALRVISITAAIAFGLLMRFATTRVPKFVIDANQISGDWKVDRKLFEEYEQQIGKWPVATAASQGTVLLLVLVLLWVLQMEGRYSLSIALLNWSFALVSDVFFMAASYRADRRVLPTLFHATLLWAFGVTTVALFCSVAFQQFPAWRACLMITLVTFFLLWSRLYRLANIVMLRLASAATEFWDEPLIEPGDSQDEGDERDLSVSP